MIKSMTGYGKGDAVSEQGSFAVEIRSVNHRYGEISVRMPRGFLALENEVKKLLANVLKRGKIDVTVQWEESSTADNIPQVDAALARGYADLFRSLGEDIGLAGDVPLSLILSQKGVFKDKAPAAVDVDESSFLPQIVSALQNAMNAIDAMRSREGEALALDLAGRRRRHARNHHHVLARAREGGADEPTDAARS